MQRGVVRLEEEGEEADEVSVGDSNFESPFGWRKFDPLDAGQDLVQETEDSPDPRSGPSGFFGPESSFFVCLPEHCISQLIKARQSICVGPGNLRGGWGHHYPCLLMGF